ncbi:MAG: LON peptidase substrate-binding domain-containing protein, partial [Acidobacteriota bacterium]
MTLPQTPSRAGDPPAVHPLITLRDMIVFPHAIRPFVVGRRASISAVESALAGDGPEFL